MRLVLLVAAVAAFLLVFGCASPPAQQTPQGANQSVSAPVEVVNASAPAGAGAGEAGLSYKEWKAPDGSITLQVPEGWKASEKQVDKCTVSWAVLNPEGTASAFMNNQIMVLKSEDARAMYKSYGMTGIDNVPVAGYLGAEEALSDVVAPLSGSTNLKMLSRDAALSSQFSQAVCISGLAACDAKVFEAAYDYKGTKMRGYYLVQSYDFGEGTTWWINVWGYEAPGEGWEKTAATLEKIFTSIKVTDEWAGKCGASSGGDAGVIGEVTRSRQDAAEKAAEEWDKYIRGE